MICLLFSVSRACIFHAGDRIFCFFDLSGVYFVALGIILLSPVFLSLGRVFRSARDHIFCSRLLRRVFRSAGNRISCFLDFYLLISRFLVIL